MGQLTHMNGKSAAYRMSKAALNVLTRVMHEELKGEDCNILINSECPGYCATGMVEGKRRMRGISVL
jgi:NAD(P)-dependent dehydrogenase (short-subunit alcohol dehydrogenase family)